MPRLKNYDRAAVDRLAAAREGVVTHQELMDLGVPLSTITSRILPSGPWQRGAPGVVIMHRGTPTYREQLLVGLALAGQDSVLTGAHSLRLHGVTGVATPWPARILVPAERHRTAYGNVSFERTHRLPEALLRNKIPVAPVARSTVDAGRNNPSVDDVRNLFAAVVQQRFCGVADLQTQVAEAARQRTAISRLVLTEVGAGIRSVAESRARKAYRTCGIPEPLWNATLRTLDGDPLVAPDAFWPQYRAVMEIDSMLWHLTPDGYKRTQARQRFYAGLGLLALPVAPSLVIDDEQEFISATDAMLQQGQYLPEPRLLFTRAA